MSMEKYMDSVRDLNDISPTRLIYYATNFKTFRNDPLSNMVYESVVTKIGDFVGKGDTI